MAAAHAGASIPKAGIPALRLHRWQERDLSLYRLLVSMLVDTCIQGCTGVKGRCVPTAACKVSVRRWHCLLQQPLSSHALLLDLWPVVCYLHAYKGRPVPTS